jgi:hypothetical protein
VCEHAERTLRAATRNAACGAPDAASTAVTGARHHAKPVHEAAAAQRLSGFSAKVTQLTARHGVRVGNVDEGCSTPPRCCGARS